VTNNKYLKINSFKLKEDLEIRHGTQKLFLMIQLEQDHFASQPFALSNDRIDFETQFIINNKKEMAINVHQTTENSNGKKSKIIGKSFKRGIPDAEGK